MNKLIRTAGRFFGGAQDQDSAAQEQPVADVEAKETPAPPATDQEIERRVQSEVDRREAKRTWDTAVKSIEDGDPGPMADLAARGDQRAERELSRRGLTYELGEARGKAVQVQEQSRAEAERIAVYTSAFDQALLEPVLEALPKDDQEKILGQGIAGLDGRKSAVTQAVAAIRRAAQKETATKLLGDEKFVRDLLADSAFRREILRNPVTNKQLRAFYRGELDEPDLNPGSGPGAGGERENDVMNDAIRSAYFGAVERGDTERAANTRTASARRGQSDLLDDDE